MACSAGLIAFQWSADLGGDVFGGTAAEAPQAVSRQGGRASTLSKRSTKAKAKAAAAAAQAQSVALIYFVAPTNDGGRARADP